MVLITHDLGVVAGVADRVAVMYAGRLVEVGDVDTVFYDPAHPYTRALLATVPRLDHDRASGRLDAIPGQPPVLAAIPAGCAFHPRCPMASLPEPCATSVPVLDPVGYGHGRDRGRQRPRQVAGAAVTLCRHRLENGDGGRAGLGERRHRAARMERAARGDGGQHGRLAGDGIEAPRCPVVVEAGDCAQQGAGPASAP